MNKPLRRSGRSPNGRPSSHSDLLIIGAGAFGTSTLYHLVHSPECPSSITILDRSPYPPTHAASTDINKVIRADYSSPFYMDLASEAVEAWSTWPELKPFYHRTGWINLHSKDNDIPRCIRENYRKRGRDPTSDMSLEQVRQRFGGIFESTQFEGQGIDTAYWNPDAGWCDAGAATAKILDEALQRGGSRTRYRQGDVQKLLLKKNQRAVAGVVTSNGQVLTADRVVLATGAWTSSIMSSIEDELQLHEQDRIERQLTAAGVCVVHFELTEKETQDLRRHMPVVIYGNLCDCQPPPASRLLKYVNAASFTHTITTASGHRITVPPTLDQRQMPKELKRETIDTITSKLLPQYSNRPVAYWRQCWDAVTPTQDWLLTRHPQIENLFIAAGGSFHSYKFLPTVGKYMVNVLHGVSNGSERDSHWCWKTGPQEGRGAHAHALPTRELNDLRNERQSRI